MVEQAKRDPTMEEIVVALRETRREAGRVPPFTVVGGQLAGNRVSGASLRGDDGTVMRGYGAGTDAQNGTDGRLDIAALRDAEIERLLGENARLNERVVFLLKVIEREQLRNDTVSDIETDRAAIVHDVRAAVEAEFRPFLLALMRLLEKRHTDPATAVPQAAPGTARPAVPEAAAGVRAPASARVTASAETDPSRAGYETARPAVPEAAAGVRAPAPARVTVSAETDASRAGYETAHPVPEAAAGVRAPASARVTASAETDPSRAGYDTARPEPEAAAGVRAPASARVIVLGKRDTSRIDCQTPPPEPEAPASVGAPAPARIIALAEKAASEVGYETAQPAVTETVASLRAVPAAVLALARKSASHFRHETARPPAPGTVPSEWIVDLTRKLGGPEDLPQPDVSVLPPRPTLRQRVVRVLDALHL